MRHDPSQRNDLIFDLIVKSYIDTAEPVGSRTISRHSDLGLSPASIRNVMSDLEESGFLKQPHTSAGRVPTDKGYRYWVDSLMEPEELGAREQSFIQEELGKARTIEALAGKICKLISELTGNAVIVYIKNMKRVSFLNYLLEELVEARKLADFFEEDTEIFIDGAARIFEQPEFQDIEKMRMLLHVFDEKADFLREFLRDPDEEVRVSIGHENRMSDLGDVSIVTKDCYLSDTPIGGVAVLGPTRMRYPKVVSVVDYVADTVSRAVRRF